MLCVEEVDGLASWLVANCVKGLLEMLGMFQCTEYYTLDLDEKI